MPVPHVENPTCAAFQEYEEGPETVPLELSEGNVAGVVSKITGAAGELEAEAIELRNWLLHFGCASEEFRVVLAIQSEQQVQLCSRSEERL